jgi:hypothetical protein
MKCHLTRARGAALGRVATIGAAAAAFTWTSISLAQNTTVVTPAPTMAPVAETRSGYTGPNRALIGTGLVTFGLSYIPAVIVAGESSQSADHHLYVPIVGPWLDLGDRPSCGVGSIACDTETTNKVLIAADGVFQGLGVLAVVAGFLTPEREHVVTLASAPAKPQKLSLHLTPAQFAGSGYGVAAFGKF